MNGERKKEERCVILPRESPFRAGEFSGVASTPIPGKGDTDTRAGGEQVARDEQGVLHGHYARSCPEGRERNPRFCVYPPSFSLPCRRGRFYIMTKEKAREKCRKREKEKEPCAGEGYNYISGNRSNPYARTGSEMVRICMHKPLTHPRPVVLHFRLARRFRNFMAD